MPGVKKPMKWDVSFIVMRSSMEQFLFAKVTATVGRPVHREEAGFKAELIEAVTEWVRKSAPGKDAWKRSSQDLNLGDLSHDVGDPLLIEILSVRGISNFAIEITSDNQACRDWTYDTVLVSESKLEVVAEAEEERGEIWVDRVKSSRRLRAAVFWHDDEIGTIPDLSKKVAFHPVETSVKIFGWDDAKKAEYERRLPEFKGMLKEMGFEAD